MFFRTKLWLKYIKEIALSNQFEWQPFLAQWANRIEWDEYVCNEDICFWKTF